VVQQTFSPESASMNAPTIVRTRGIISIKLTSYAADLDFCGVLGMGIVSDEALAAGAASIPRPFDDADWPGWFVWEPFCSRFEFLDATGTKFPAALSWKFDSKAMRKVRVNETVVVMVESQSGAFETAVFFRQLYKLS